MKVHHDLNLLPEFRRPVVTIGSFDGVHLGHQKLLARIRERAEEINGESVLVTFDPHPRHVLASSAPPMKLLTTTAEKIERIEKLGIDHVVIVEFNLAFAKQTAIEYLDDFLFGKFNPHTVVIGYDHRFGAGRSGNIDLLRKKAAIEGIVVREISALDEDNLAVSSTRIRNALALGDVASANQLLGSPYPLTGKVVHGEAIGRTIGFPTANLELQSKHKLLPANGVYAVKAQLLGSYASYKAMLYIGDRPSLKDERAHRIEVNLLDFSGDLYDEILRIEVLEHVRGDQAFESLDALKSQIENDRDAIQAIFSSYES